MKLITLHHTSNQVSGAATVVNPTLSNEIYKTTDNCYWRGWNQTQRRFTVTGIYFILHQLLLAWLEKSPALLVNMAQEKRGQLNWQSIAWSSESPSTITIHSFGQTQYPLVPYHAWILTILNIQPLICGSVLRTFGHEVDHHWINLFVPEPVQTMLWFHLHLLWLLWLGLFIFMS